MFSDSHGEGAHLSSNLQLQQFPIFNPAPANQQAYADHGESPRLQSFEAYRNTCSGPVLIVASGPSTKAFPLERFRHIPMMAMNGSICRFAQVGIRPRFYLCDDSSFVRNRLPWMIQASGLAEHMVLSPRVIDTLLGLECHALDGRSVFRFERAGRCVEGGGEISPRRFAWRIRNDADFECSFSLWRQKPNRIGFSRNMSKGYFNGRTIPYAAIQLACHLGYEQVFLLGVELDSCAGRFYECAETAVPSRIDGDYDEYILPSFQLLADKVINPQFQVFNLAGSGRLPEQLVPRVALDQFEAMLARA